MHLSYPAIYSDFYELTMAQGYFLSGKHLEKASFDYFFRKCPFNGGYVVFAGLTDFLDLLSEFKFGTKELSYLKQKGFKSEFLEHLKSFQFTGTIHSVKEGEIIFPNEPVVRVEGTILEAQIIETLLLNILNFESLVATKASRIRAVAGDKLVLDFGLRRSQAFGGLHASKASIIGGLNGTSNVYAGLVFGLDISGTMAHSWIQSFEDELTAFRTYSEHYPDSTVLLVDTYDTLKSGIPNAITVAKELEEKGYKLKAVRLDSGDLAYFSKKARQQLDKAGLQYVQIAISNQLDEHLIKSLNDQHAPIDIFGVGTKLVTAYDNPALDGVYKLSSIDGRPTLKISENVEKVTLPASKKITRFYNSDGSFNCDGISLVEEEELNVLEHPYFPLKKTPVAELKSQELLSPVVVDGKITTKSYTAYECAEYAKSQLQKLNPEHKRFDNPHVYKVGISERLADLRNRLIDKK
ncbi:MAG: nicotinate phosphoribosyltransferase [Balneolaceae bacterium]